MSYKRLLILVEGDTDREFLTRVFKPLINHKYNLIQYKEYSQKKYREIKDYIKTFKSIDKKTGMAADYIYIRDINNKPCVTEIKKEIKKKVKNIDPEKIVIVIKEIESWYLAGIPEDKIDEFNIQRLRNKNVNDLTKEDFKQLYKDSKFKSDIDFLAEVLKNFDIETAKQKSKSFRYFIEKFS